VNMRDSGVPWLGEIPAHWELWKIGHLARVGNGSTPERDNSEYWTDGSVPWLNSSVVNQDEVTTAEQFVTDLARRECHLPLLQPGTVLIAITGQGKTRGQAVVLSISATINQHMAFVAPNPDLIATWFLRWSFYRAYEYLRSISDDAGGTKGALTCEDVANLRIPVPPLDEQSAIIARLAHETVHLDALLAAKQRLLDLLAEKRKAIIATAVTRGLDPKVKLRDSGVPWLGEIPAHWESRNLRFCCTSIQTGGTPAPEFLDYDGDDGLDWLTPGDFVTSSRSRCAERRRRDDVSRWRRPRRRYRRNAREGWVASTACVGEPAGERPRPERRHGQHLSCV
jgi:restriction endonuclease S subunit